MKVLLNVNNKFELNDIEEKEFKELALLYFYSKDDKNISNSKVVYVDIDLNKIKKIPNQFAIYINNMYSLEEYKKIVMLLKNNLNNYGILAENKKILAIIPNDFSGKYEKEFLKTLFALSISDIKKQYEYIYDNICNDLDDEFIKNNICDFKNDQCVANRAGKSGHDTMGCCYSFNYSKSPFRLIENVHLCDHMKEKKCETSCISCKIFTCKYLKKKGIKFDINSFLLAMLFNRKQKDVLTSNFFKKKEEIIQKLIEVLNNKQFYWKYYLDNNCRINKW